MRCILRGALLSMNPSGWRSRPILLLRINTDDAGSMGMRAARSIALLSYRNYDTYNFTQARDNPDQIDDFRASSYQQYQGDKFVKRFNAYSYWALSKIMDSHNVGRNRGGIVHALGLVKAKTLVLGIKSDLLFPLIGTAVSGQAHSRRCFSGN